MGAAQVGKACVPLGETSGERLKGLYKVRASRFSKCGHQAGQTGRRAKRLIQFNNGLVSEECD